MREITDIAKVIPDCGCNNKDYLNDDQRKAEGVSIKHSGSCEEKTKPVAPTKISANALNQNTIRLTWPGLDKTLVDKFTIYRNPPVGDVNNTGPDTTITFDIDNLNCGQNYAFYITSTNSQGESDPSVYVSATTNACSQTQDQSQTQSQNNGLANSIGRLVSTGSSLQLNLIIALLGIAAVGYFIYRSDIWKKQ